MMNRSFLIILALGLWANAAATIVHAAWTSTRELTTMNAKLGQIEQSVTILSTALRKSAQAGRVKP